MDTSHKVGGWKKTAKYDENCKKKTQKKMRIQKKKNEIFFVFSSYLNNKVVVSLKKRAKALQTVNFRFLNFQETPFQA